jgi:hypothetical protein
LNEHESLERDVERGGVSDKEESVDVLVETVPEYFN